MDLSRGTIERGIMKEIQEFLGVHEEDFETVLERGKKIFDGLSEQDRQALFMVIFWMVGKDESLRNTMNMVLSKFESKH